MKSYFKFLWTRINDSYSLMVMGMGILGYTIAGTINHKLSFGGYLSCIGTVFIMLLISITLSFIILKTKGRIK